MGLRRLEMEILEEDAIGGLNGVLLGIAVESSCPAGSVGSTVRGKHGLAIILAGNLQH